MRIEREREKFPFELTREDKERMNNNKHPTHWINKERLIK